MYLSMREHFLFRLFSYRPLLYLCNWNEFSWKPRTRKHRKATSHSSISSISSLSWGRDYRQGRWWEGKLLDQHKTKTKVKEIILLIGPAGARGSELGAHVPSGSAWRELYMCKCGCEKKRIKMIKKRTITT